MTPSAVAFSRRELPHASSYNAAAGSRAVPDQTLASPGVDIRNAASVSDIRAALQTLRSRETSITASLDALLASQKRFSRELARLDLLRAKLGAQVSAVRSISNDMLSDASSSASHISKAVKHLDMEQERVRSTLSVVEQVVELKACVLGVAASMGVSQDWETAANYVHRASKIPRDIVTGNFAANIVPTTEVPDAPDITLNNAAESLCHLFLREFDRAVHDNDTSKITRFFKLFPLIGRAEVGLDVYGRYVCQGVATRARSNLSFAAGARESPYFHATVLTKLFEQIAQIIESHGPLVERHYGAESMTQVIQRLQAEADMQGNIILETWTEERAVDRKLTDIKSYAFTFLVQSFLSTRSGPAASGVSSPAPQAIDNEGVEMKDVDSLLNEMAMMLQRWSLYTRFITDKCTHNDVSPSVPEFLSSSALMQKINDCVINPFNTMNTFFLRRAVEKAFQLDEQPTGLNLNLHAPLSASSSPPYISSAVDDIMYIVNRILRQSMDTGQLSVVKSVIFTLTRVLGSEFIGMIQRKMRDEYYPRATVSGGSPSELIIIGFLVLINNLDVAVEYVHRIASSQLTDDYLKRVFSDEGDAESVRTSMNGFTSSFESKAADLLGDGIQVMHNNVVKPRLRPILSEAFRDVSYTPEPQDSYAFADAPVDGTDENDVQARFKRDWMELMLPLSRLLTQKSFERLLQISLTALARLLEKRVWAYHGRVNCLGANRLERDVRGLISEAVFIGERSQAYKFRGIFARCTEIVLIMGLEEEEWVAMNPQQQGSIRRDDSSKALLGALSAEERMRARAAITDR
ncbi:hypothetical protein KEM56_006321 [Ascosphaera pollenicola]|nr:hypothetical protein KEM56_006321 [Ascosphaera pollenicola]